MSKPMTDEELQSFYEYAGANMVEPGGSQCQWADYSSRCVEEIRLLRKENERARQLLKKTLEHVLLARNLKHVKPISCGLLRTEIRAFLEPNEAEK